MHVFGGGAHGDDVPPPIREYSEERELILRSHVMMILIDAAIQFNGIQLMYASPVQFYLDATLSIPYRENQFCTLVESVEQ